MTIGQHQHGYRKLKGEATAQCDPGESRWSLGESDGFGDQVHPLTYGIWRMGQVQ